MHSIHFCRFITSAGLLLMAASALPAQVVSPDIKAFHEAALHGHADKVREAVAAGTDMETEDEMGRTALMLAAFNGHDTVIDLLLNAGAEIDHRDQSGRTALMFASTGPNPKAVARLLDAGAEVDLVDKEEHFSALMYAAAEGQAAVVDVLLEAGADPKLKDVDGDTASDFALRRGFFNLANRLGKKE